MDASGQLGLLRVAALPFETLAAFHDEATIACLERMVADESAIDRAARDLEEALYRAAGPSGPADPASGGRPPATSSASSASFATGDRVPPVVVADDEARPATAKRLPSPRLRLLEARRRVHHRHPAGIAAAAIALRDHAPRLAARLLDFTRPLERRAGQLTELEALHAGSLDNGRR